MRRIVFVWDNFGPIHADRASAVASKFADRYKVIGIELTEKSDTYDWVPETGDGFEKITIERGSVAGHRSSKLLRWGRLQFALLRNLGSAFFFCHYERPSIFLSALLLRVLGQRVFVMNDSKFDDYDRSLFREFIKLIFYSPYCGGLASGIRARDYMRFLGVPRDNIVTNYNCISYMRVRNSAGAPAAPNGLSFENRHFTVLARLVPKKNLFTVLDAYAAYLLRTTQPRRLKIAGSGPLEQDLRSHASAIGVSDMVDFLGFIQAAEVAALLSSTLVLLLLSTEEQFGNVVLEASAMGVPSIVSTACGVRDMLVQTGVTGFIVEPTNPDGTAYFMTLLGEQRDLWERMAKEVTKRNSTGDVSHFVEGVSDLIARK